MSMLSRSANWLLGLHPAKILFGSLLMFAAVLGTLLVHDGTIPVTAAGRDLRDQREIAQAKEERKRALFAADRLSQRIEYFEDRRTHICFAHIYMLAHDNWDQVLGPVDCTNPGVARLLENGISGHVPY